MIAYKIKELQSRIDDNMKHLFIYPESLTARIGCILGRCRLQDFIDNVELVIYKDEVDTSQMGRILKTNR